MRALPRPPVSRCSWPAGPLIAGLAFAAAAATFVAAAQTLPEPESGRGPDRMASAVGVQNLSHQDRKFIEQALSNGMAEVIEAELAERQAASPDVRRAADHLREDHELTNTELQRIAATHGIVAPKEPPENRRAIYSRLRSLTGAKFDDEFVRAQIVAHNNAITLFRRAQIESSNRTVRTFAATTLPKLRQHLAMLESARERGNTPAGARQSSGSAAEPVGTPVEEGAGQPVEAAVQPPPP